MPRLARLYGCLTLLSLSLCSSLHSAKILPVLNTPLADLSSLPGAGSQSFDLTSVFGSEAIDDQVVRFTTQSSIGSLTLDFALFSNRAPGTRSNFLNYVNDGDYQNSIIHRSVPNFVIQGGGYYDSNPTADYFISAVPTDAPIANEFGISNTLGTISMAKLGGDPDSATSQWFISLGDNSANLDNQNGGFTVFGRVTKSTLNNALAIGNPFNFPRWNFGGAFSSIPLSPAYNGFGNPTENDFVLFTTVELVDIDPADAGTSTALSYSVAANSNPSIVTASIANGSDLLLDAVGSEPGVSVITVRATDSVGNTVEDTFSYTILRYFADWQTDNFTQAELADPQVSGPGIDENGDGLTNLELYLHGLSRNGYFNSPVEFNDLVISGQRYPTFTFPIRNDMADISFSLEQSNDLGLTNDWNPVAFTEISRTTDGPIDTVQIRADNPVGEPSDFYRIRFTQD